MGNHEKDLNERGMPYYIFKGRPPEVANLPSEKLALAKKIMDVTDCVGMELYSGYENAMPQRGLAEDDDVFGCTMPPGKTKDRVKIFISYEQLQSLVRDDLTPSER